jgi:predicted nucleic acid-binding protein
MHVPMKIYLDTCILNRLTDADSQHRVREEAEALLRILELVASGDSEWITSDAVQFELEANPDPMKRAEALPLLEFASTTLRLNQEVRSAAIELQQQGLALFDALHLALCEAFHVHYLLTVDDRFIGWAAHNRSSGGVEVMNPIDWLRRRDLWPLKPQLLK